MQYVNFNTYSAQVMSKLRKGYEMKDIVILTFQLCAIALIAPRQAHAYIDPAFGSMVLQGLAAGAITLMVFLRGFRRKIASFLKKTLEKDKGQE